MVVTLLILYNALAFLLIILIFRTYKYFTNRMVINKIPGPKPYPVIGNVMDILISPNALWKLLRYFAKRYYPIFKVCNLHKQAIVCFSPEDVEQILSSSKHITKGEVYTVLEPWLNTGLLTSTGTKWQSRRKILTPAFHFNILQQFIPIFIEQTELLLQSLDAQCNQPHTNIVPIISRFTLHSICETAMGTRLNIGEKQHKYVKNVHRFGELALHRIIRPWFYFKETYFFTPQFWESRRVINFMHKFSGKVIKERKCNLKESYMVNNELYTTKRRLAMLDLLIAAQRSGANIDDIGIREEVDTFMFEGHDTTAMCISFTMMLLANTIEIQDRVVEELKDVFHGSNRAPSYQDLQKLNYLEMVIKESLRLYPSVPIISRIADVDIHTSSGYSIPKSSNILISIYDLHHNAEIYPDPEKFDPNRFLPSNSQKRHPFSYVPFSAGPRNCIGQRFAMLEIKTALSSILRRYELEAVHTPADLELITDIIIRSQNGIRIKLKLRK